MGRFKIILLAVIAVVTFSCSSSDKDNAPQLTITFPTSETTFVRSNSFTFSGTATDDVELKKISFSLEYKPGLKGLEDAWLPEPDVRDISGKSITYANEEIFSEPIEYSSKSGVYTLLVEVTDRKGNVTSKTVDVTID